MRLILLAVLLATLAACQKASHTTADGLPFTPKPGATGDGIPVNPNANSD